MNRKTIIRQATAAVAAAAVAAMNCAPVYAQGKVLTADDIAAAIHKNDELYDAFYSKKTSAEPYFITRNPRIDVSTLPSKFDLRDVDGKNYVSPVKLQNPWGTCWSFGATAAAET